LYDGPFCVLSIVDNHRFRRLIYWVLDHDPTHEDITRLLRRFQRALEARGLRLLGITTDGSNFYTGPIAGVFGPVPHQICEFHVIAKLTRAALRAVAKVRRHMKAHEIGTEGWGCGTLPPSPGFELAAANCLAATPCAVIAPTLHCLPRTGDAPTARQPRRRGSPPQPSRRTGR